VAIRIVPRDLPAAPETPAGAAGESALTFQRAAADEALAPTPAAGAGRQLAKQAPSARRFSAVAPALLASMRREVNVAVSDVPLADLLAQLGQSGKVTLSLSPAVTETMRAHADLRGVPLHEALAKVADAAGLVIAPQGAGVLLRPRAPTVGRPARTSVWAAEWGDAPRLGFPLPAGSDNAR
jgi:hypothetical protein